jgi:2-polyprenyl-6-methoxyphenol hydroxylase-like FAD-dependent oxidoreductase
MAAPRAIIIGAGIAGLSSAIALRKAGWRVEVFEQAQALEPMGAALGIWPNAVAALDWLGCADGLREKAAPLNALVLATSGGGTIMRNAVDRILPGRTGYLPSRSFLQAILLEQTHGIPLHLNSPLQSFEERTDCVVVFPGWQGYRGGNAGRGRRHPFKNRAQTYRCLSQTCRLWRSSGPFWPGCGRWH